jgi:hypothetical protein
MAMPTWERIAETHLGQRPCAALQAGHTLAIAPDQFFLRPTLAPEGSSTHALQLAMLHRRAFAISSTVSENSITIDSSFIFRCDTLFQYCSIPFAR